MAQIIGIDRDADNEPKTGLRISDPTCGSGRNLLSHHAENPGNFYFGEDIDRTCCLMTVCNFIIHGCVGEVVWHNSLDPESYYCGWSVNPWLNRTGIPGVIEISKEKSYIWQSWQQRKLQNEAKKAEQREPPKPVKPEQLSLF